MRTQRRGRRATLSGALGLGIVLIPALAAADPVADGFTAPAARVDTTLTALFDGYGDTSGTWSGADSAYSVPLPDGSTAWLYSDTFIGPVNPDHTRDLDTAFVRNSINVVDSSGITTYTGGTTATPRSLVQTPGGDDDPSEWYWFGDGTVEGDTLHVMLLKFARTGAGMWDWEFAGSDIASFALPGMTPLGVTPLGNSGIHWGSAILEQDGVTYVYGVEDLSSVKYVHVAQVPAGSLTDPAAWRYWDGTAWTADAPGSARVTTGVSNEFSVHVYQGRYTLVAQDTSEPLSAKVVALRADSPVGPFDPPVTLYTTPETGGNVFTYNAKAHPQLGDEDTLVVTYNVNSFDTNDLYADVANYRPRYVDVDTRANAQLTVGVTADPGQLVEGGSVTLTATVANAAGVDAAGGTTVTHVLPAGLDYVSATPAATFDPATRTVTWPAATVAPGSSATFAVTATVNAPAGTTLASTASVSAPPVCAAGCTAQYSGVVAAAEPGPAASSGAPDPADLGSPAPGAAAAGAATASTTGTAATNGGRLARTGSSALLPVAAGALVLLTAGAAALVLRRRRAAR